jgi:hypothetical protein
MFSLGLDTTHFKLKRLKLQWVFEKGWITMSSMQIHKHLPPLLHPESYQWISTILGHVIYTRSYLSIHVKYEGTFWRQKNKAQVKGQKKNAPLMSMSLLASLGTHCMKLYSLGSHLVLAFRITHSKFTQVTFHFYRCFCKCGHTKESITKTISKGQCATTNMKNVKLLFEHYCCLVFFIKRFIFASWLETRMELQKKILCRNLLLEWWIKKGLA